MIGERVYNQNCGCGEVVSLGDKRWEFGWDLFVWMDNDVAGMGRRVLGFYKHELEVLRGVGSE